VRPAHRGLVEAGRRREEAGGGSAAPSPTRGLPPRCSQEGKCNPDVTSNSSTAAGAAGGSGPPDPWTCPLLASVHSPPLLLLLFSSPVSSRLTGVFTFMCKLHGCFLPTGVVKHFEIPVRAEQYLLCDYAILTLYD